MRTSQPREELLAAWRKLDERDRRARARNPHDYLPSIDAMRPIGGGQGTGDRGRGREPDANELPFDVDPQHTTSHGSRHVDCSECEPLSPVPCPLTPSLQSLTIEQIIMEEDAELYVAFQQKYADWEWMKVTRETMQERGRGPHRTVLVRIWIKCQGDPVFPVTAPTAAALLDIAAN